MERKQGFQPPSEQRRIKALGDFTNECEATKKALTNVQKYWEPIRPPKCGDWLDTYNHGCYTYDQFGGKKITDTKNTIYIQPIVYKKNSHITNKNMEQLQKWLQAFYMPCRVEILPKIYEDTLKNNQNIDTQTNMYGNTQYNAIHILKHVIGPIQNSKRDAIGVLSFTDVDLFTKNLSNFCFGYGIPALGGVQSLHRFMPEFTDEFGLDKDELESKTLMRICKIATHEIGHMFGHGHCIFYQCLMMGTNHLEQTDRNPIYFCPVCYRKLWKCLKFDHVKRYKALSKACEQFSQTFLEPQRYEMNNLSVKGWIDQRYFDLKDKITDNDYNKDGQNFLRLPLISEYRNLSNNQNSQKDIISQGSVQSRSSKSAPKAGSFLKRGQGQIKKEAKIPLGKWK